MSKHLIYHMNLNTETENFGGKEWIVDGDMGRWNYPGQWDAATVCKYYEDGIAFNQVEGKKDAELRRIQDVSRNCKNNARCPS